MLGLFAESVDAQETNNDSLLRVAFEQDVAAMVDSMQMSDSVQVRFYEIYHAYGALMKEAYENRTSWIVLNHTYQWAVRDRDSKLKAILTPEQLYYFKKRQSEIEQAARKRKRDASRQSP